KPIAFAEVAGSGRNFVGFARVPIDRAAEYAAEDADVTLRLWRALKPRLAADFAQSMARLEDDISRIVGGPFNPGSPKQLGDILFGQMGMPGGKRTAT